MPKAPGRHFPHVQCAALLQDSVWVVHLPCFHSAPWLRMVEILSYEVCTLRGPLFNMYRILDVVAFLQFLQFLLFFVVQPVPKFSQNMFLAKLNFFPQYLSFLVSASCAEYATPVVYTCPRGPSGETYERNTSPLALLRGSKRLVACGPSAHPPPPAQVA